MAKLTYYEKLKDPRWQKLRLEKLQASGWACESCGDSESTLHIHHRQYFKGREPWEYELGQLEVLCEHCHSTHHEEEDFLQLAASYIESDGPYSRSSAASLLAGFCHNGINAPYVGDPELYVLGEIAQAMSPWRSKGALTAFELCDLRDALIADLGGFSANARAYIAGMKEQGKLGGDGK